MWWKRQTLIKPTPGIDDACHLDTGSFECFYVISRYAINSWGVFYLEAQKGYSTLDASFIISICPVCGIVGTIFSGVISDKLFGGRRNVPALIFGLMNVLALSLFLLVPVYTFG